MTVKDARLPYTEISADFLAPRDPVLGYIKIGGKEQTPRFAKSGRPWVAPVRYVEPARFEITTREKVVKKVKGQGKAANEWFNVDLGYVRDTAFHDRIEDNAPTRLRVRLMYPEWQDNLIAFMGAHSGKEWVCRGNGVEATDVKRGACVCPCPRLKQFAGTYKGTPPSDAYPCKPHGQLNVILEDAEVFGGFWAFKTTSFESISNIRHFLQGMQSMFGRVDGLPFEQRVFGATKSFGEGQTTQPIVTLVLAASMDTARQVAAGAAAESQKYLSAGGAPDPESYRAAVVAEMEEEEAALVGEFHPEVVEAAAEAPEAPTIEGDWELEEDGSPEAEEVEAAPEPTEPEATEEVDDRQEQLCRRALKEAGWEPEAINGRVEHHKRDGSLGDLETRIQRNMPDAWAKASSHDLFEPDDGLAGA